MLKRTLRGSVLSAAAAWAVCGMAWSAFADLPAAMDRVPADAVVAVSMKDIAKFHGQFKKLTEATGVVGCRVNSKRLALPTGRLTDFASMRLVPLLRQPLAAASKAAADGCSGSGAHRRPGCRLRL